MAFLLFLSYFFPRIQKVVCRQVFGPRLVGILSPFQADFDLSLLVYLISNYGVFPPDLYFLVIHVPFSSRNLIGRNKAMYEK